jgi:hypothetical protein
VCAVCFTGVQAIPAAVIFVRGVVVKTRMKKVKASQFTANEHEAKVADQLVSK